MLRGEGTLRARIRVVVPSCIISPRSPFKVKMRAGMGGWLRWHASPEVHIAETRVARLTCYNGKNSVFYNSL